MTKKFLTDKELAEILANSDSEDEAFCNINSEVEDEEEEPECAVMGEDMDHESEAEKEAVEIGDSFEEDDNQTAETTPKPKRKKRPDKNLNPFNWKDDEFVPIIHNFSDENSGCLVNLNDASSELDCFQCFLTEEIVEFIASETNKYAQYLLENCEEFSRLKRWKDTSLVEMYRFFAVNLLMPQVKKRKINDYWSNDFLLATPVFGQIMSRDRYLLILRALHFMDNNEPTIQNDSLLKIRKIVDHMKDTFKNSFYPFKNVCIDESLLLFKGRVFFKQYIPSKRHRFGVKFFLLCDCETGFVLDFIIYTGSTTEINTGFDEEGLGKSGQIVLTMMESYLGKGHTLFVDNWYSSPTLFNFLHDRLTNACGTVKRNRLYLPALNTKLRKGEVEYRTSRNMLVLKWHDKRDVLMLTTCHDNTIVNTEKIDRETKELKQKPKCIDEYNKHMGAVDKSDLVLSAIESVRKTVKWYKKVFFHFLDLSLLNAWILYKTATGKNPTCSEFQLAVVRQILEKYNLPSPSGPPGRRSDNAESPMRLTERHFPGKIPPTATNKNKVRRCVVCSKNNIRSESRFMCVPCNVPLCIIPCFQKYHTVKRY